MIEAARLAGYVTSQAFEFFSKQVFGVALYGHIDHDGNMQFERIQGSVENRTQKEAIRICKKKLKENSQKYPSAVIVYNNLNRQPTDSEMIQTKDGLYQVAANYIPRSLVTEFIDYEQMPEPMSLGFPNEYEYESYINIYDAEKYHVPKNILGDTESFIFEAFFDGLHKHEKGAEFLFENNKPRPEPIFEEEINVSEGFSDEELEKMMDSGELKFLEGEKIDDYKWHYSGAITEENEDNQLCFGMGVFFSWCIMNNLSNMDYKEEASKIRQLYMKREHGPGIAFLDLFGGTLHEAYLNDKGYALAAEYYQDQYIDDLTSTLNMPEGEYIYTGPDTWDEYDKVAPIIQKRFEEWQASYKESH